MDHMTAKVSCFARAYHHKNNQVCIFDDPMAEKLLGNEYEQIAENMAAGVKFFLSDFKGTKEEGLRLIVDRQLSPSVLGRSVFCEEKLSEAVKHGCSQYLLFASGYDTFALRNPESFLSIYELDFPELLADKRMRIKRAHLKSASVDVPCNLGEISWKQKLLETGYHQTEKVFGSLLGISYYLRKEEFEQLLKNVHEIMTEGSMICFDYPSVDESKETKTNQVLASGAGEQMKILYSYEELEALLERCGFKVMEHLEHRGMTDRYFKEYNQNNPMYPMRAPKGVGYVLASD